MDALYDRRMTNAETPDTRYASYLLRFRLVWSDDQPVWIASVENTVTGSYRSFPNVEALAAFLLAEFGRRGSTVTGSLPSESEDHRLPESE
jgi:hypothetical protein